VDAHEGLSEIYWKQQKKEAAVQELKLAVEALKNKVRSEKGVQTGRDYQDFKDDFVSVAEQAKTMGMQLEFAPHLVGILQNYLKFTGGRFIREMISVAAPDPHNTRAITSFILELSYSAANPAGFLKDFAEKDHGLKLDTEPILRRVVEILRHQARHPQSNEDGENDEVEYGNSGREEWEIKWFEALLQTRQYDRLREEIGRMPKSPSDEDRASLLSIQLRLAAATGKLDSTLVF